MATFRDRLVTQAEPLDAHEVGILEAWLRVLREDVAAFGAAPEDEARMAAIEARIARERSGCGKNGVMARFVQSINETGRMG